MNRKGKGIVLQRGTAILQRQRRGYSSIEIVRKNCKGQNQRHHDQDINFF
jgi:hypothetical protein